MNILEIAKLIPAGKQVAIKVGSTDNIWTVEEVIQYYSRPGVNPNVVLGLDTVHCPEFGDTEPMIQITVK